MYANYLLKENILNIIFYYKSLIRKTYKYYFISDNINSNIKLKMPFKNSNDLLIDKDFQEKLN